MPPRRTTRKASVAPSSGSPEPENTSGRSSRSATSKRKRAEAELEKVPEAEDDVHQDSEDEEAPRKPSSRARKTTSRQPSVPRGKGRATSTRKVSAQSIPEEVEEDVPSPPKKTKNQVDVITEDEEEDEEIVAPQSRRAAARTKPTGRAPAQSKRVSRPVELKDERVEDEDDNCRPEEDSSEDEQPKRTARNTKQAARGPPKKLPSVRSTKSRVKKEVIEEMEESVVLNSDEEETKDETLSPDSKPASTNEAKEPRLTSVPTTDAEEQEVDQLTTPRASTRIAPRSAATSLEIPKPDDDSEDEPERSLLDDLPTSTAVKPRLSTIPQAPIPEEPQGPKSRLVIHKMVLVNFKSYAGRQVIGPFHKSFSAIVGPNGSGKSNTIDALLFVFGYRASKMRQGKLSELIHNSANYPDLDECAVEVHFREIVDLPGPDAYEVVPDSQLVVARYAYKSNSSKYTINGRTSSFTEVTSLLKGRGIDLDHKRFLILQGEVESIAQMKPKASNEHEDGLLEYLEDIIGTSRYKEPIEEALIELDALAEHRTEKLNRLRIVEREKNSLEEKKREAEEYLRLQNEHVRAQSRLYQYNLWKCLEKEQEYNERIETLENELQEETERNKDDINHCELLEKHYKERGEAYEAVKEAAAVAVKDLSVHEKQQVNLAERKKHATGKAKKLKKSIHEDQKSRDEAIRFVETNSVKMEKEREKLTEYEDSLSKEEKLLEEIRDSLKDKTQVYHDQIEVKQRELQPWTTKINQKQSEIDVAISERDALSKKAEEVRSLKKEAMDNLENLKAEYASKDQEKAELRKRKTDLQKDKNSGERKLQDLRNNVEELRSKASATRQKADEAKASQAASTSQNKVLDSLTKLRNTGRISGFHGRLGSLGTIAEKYDVAISTACPGLNNLIVDTVDQGQACIEYLRKQNIGRASFIVLEKLSQTNGLDKIATPENVPRLFDLIKPKEPKFAPAFFKAIGNTLVADDLEQANRIAYGQRRWRVVTLTGQLIDTSGTMSGGGTHVQKGAMSSKLAAEAVHPDVLRKYEKDSESALHLLETAQEELRGFEVELDRLDKEIPEVDMALQKIDLDIQTGAKRIAEAEKRIREVKTKSKPDEEDLARIETLNNEIDHTQQELQRLQEKKEVVDKAIKDLEKKILEVGGAKLLMQKSKVDSIKLHINLALDEITKAEVNVEKAGKDSIRHEKSIETNTKFLDEVESELQELEEELEECNELVAQLQEKVDSAQSAAENAKDDLDNLKRDLDVKLEEIQKFREREMEINQALTDVRKEAAENENNLTRNQKLHDKLKLEDIDEEDEEEETNAQVEAIPEANAMPAKEKDDAMSEVDEAETLVKPEPVDGEVPPSKPARTPPHELHIYTVEELSRFRRKELLADVSLLEDQIKNANPNMDVLKEYRKREQEFLNRAKDLEEVTQRRDAQKAKYDGLRKQRLDEFMTGFNTISSKLKEMYQMITLGGNAELELVDSMDPFSEGIIFSVMPPKKSWKNISNLSGGEKTLSSLALVFALHVFKPTPLYFMDEIDAALDFRNVSIVANYIKDRTKNAQFIIISLRNDMFELSHRLIGIYKTSNATRSISINNHALNAIPINTIKA